MLLSPSQTCPTLELPDSICSSLITREPGRKSLAGRQKREADYADGRAAAADALRKLDCLGFVGRKQNGCPRWPIGFVGSISHSRNFAWAMASNDSEYRSIGIDTEPLCEAETAESLLDQIAGGTEWRLCRKAGLNRQEAFTVVFSAKEALYKCVYPLSPTFFDFDDVCLVEIRSDKLSLRVNDDSPNRLMRGVEIDVSYAVSATDVFTACWLRRSTA